MTDANPTYVVFKPTVLRHKLHQNFTVGVRMGNNFGCYP